MDVDPSTDRLLPLYGNAYSDTLTSSPDTVTYICTLAQNGKIMTFSRQGEYLPEVWTCTSLKESQVYTSVDPLGS